MSEPTKYEPEQGTTYWRWWLADPVTSELPPEAFFLLTGGIALPGGKVVQYDTREAALADLQQARDRAAPGRGEGE